MDTGNSRTKKFDKAGNFFPFILVYLFLEHIVMQLIQMNRDVFDVYMVKNIIINYIE